MPNQHFFKRGDKVVLHKTNGLIKHLSMDKVYEVVDAAPDQMGNPPRRVWIRGDDGRLKSWLAGFFRPAMKGDMQ